MATALPPRETSQRIDSPARRIFRRPMTTSMLYSLPRRLLSRRASVGRRRDDRLAAPTRIEDCTASSSASSNFVVLFVGVPAAGRGRMLGGKSRHSWNSAAARMHGVPMANCPDSRPRMSPATHVDLRGRRKNGTRATHAAVCQSAVRQTSFSKRTAHAHELPAIASSGSMFA